MSQSWWNKDNIGTVLRWCVLHTTLKVLSNEQILQYLLMKILQYLLYLKLKFYYGLFHWFLAIYADDRKINVTKWYFSVC